MIGFGGIATPMAYAELSEAGKAAWWELVRDYNLLIQREYPIGARLAETLDNWDNPDHATPHYYGDNFPNGEISDFDYIRKIRELGGEVWFEFWALPAWMGKDTDRYAEAMANYCEVSKARAGAPPDVVGVQNEVGQSTAQFQAMTRALRAALNARGFSDVKIHMSDASTLSGGIARAKQFRADPAVWALVDFSAAHMYDYQGFFRDPDAYDDRLREWKGLTGDRPFLSTELCVNDTRYQVPSYRLAFAMGQLYHKNLVLADAAAISYCWTLLNVEQPSYGWTRSLCVPDHEAGSLPVASSHQLRMFGAFSRRIRKGMVRLETNCDAGDLLASAFAEPDGDARTLVLLNRGTAPCRAVIDWPKARFAEVERVSPTAIHAIETVDASGEALVVAPGEVVTITNVVGGK